MHARTLLRTDLETRLARDEAEVTLAHAAERYAAVAAQVCQGQPTQEGLRAARAARAALHAAGVAYCAAWGHAAPETP